MILLARKIWSITSEGKYWLRFGRSGGIGCPPLGGGSATNSIGVDDDDEAAFCLFSGGALGGLGPAAGSGGGGQDTGSCVGRQSGGGPFGCLPTFTAFSGTDFSRGARGSWKSDGAGRPPGGTAGTALIGGDAIKPSGGAFTRLGSAFTFVAAFTGAAAFNDTGAAAAQGLNGGLLVFTADGGKNV
jgi:hypothetical protein